MPIEVLIITLASLLIPLIIVPTAMGIRHARYLRDVEHTERLRAMELGRPIPVPGEPRSSTGAKLAFAIGVGVPVASMLAAFLASESLGFHTVIWATCGWVAVSGVAGGVYLASRLPQEGHDATALRKAVHDPDAFDVVSRRG